MNRILVALAALALTSCSTTGGTLTPIKAVGSASGDMSGPQVFIGGYPVNALVKVHGTITYTVQPIPPYLTYDGSYEIIVEPVPGMENEAIAAVTRGELLIRKNGQPAALNAPGSIAGYKARLMEMYAPKPSSAPLPPPPPVPAAKPLTRYTPPVVLDSVCVGDECSVPCPR